MAKYIDGFVLVVPKNKIVEYKKMATEGKKMWMKFGALGYYECMGDDLKPQEMGEEKTRNFAEMAGAKRGETVWFSFIIYKSKKHRDQVNAKVMEQMGKDAEKYQGVVMPFDMKRMAYGGFEAVVAG